jgi:repressor LexA
LKPKYKNNLRMIREKRNITGIAIAGALEITPTYYYELEKGQKRLNETLLHKLAGHLNVSTDYILGRANTPGGKRKVPILGVIRAGIPLLAEDNWIGDVEIPSDLQADFALGVTGDSMSWAGIHEGDLAILLKQEGIPYSGEIVAAGVEEMEWCATLKFYIEEKGKRLLRAANPHYGDLELTDSYRLIGRVVSILKKPPALQDYLNILMPKEIVEQSWREVIAEAVSYGLSGEKVKALLGLFADIAKKL